MSSIIGTPLGDSYTLRISIEMAARLVLFSVEKAQ